MQALVALSLGAVGCLAIACPGDSPSPSELARALGRSRQVEPRLTGGFAYTPCRPVPAQGGLLPKPRCSDPLPRSRSNSKVLAKLVIRLQRQLERKRSRSVVWTYGLALLVDPQTPETTEKAVALLEEASALAPADARILSDLAAAYYVRAQQTERPEDLVRALEMARRAVEKDGSLQEARFNEALSLQALSLRSGAAKEWRRYLRSDSHSPWGAEARAHLRAFQAGDAADSWDKTKDGLEIAASQGDRDVVRTAVAQFPQAVRLLIEEHVLPDWANAVAEGRRGDADRLLHEARVIAAELARYGGDFLLADTVEDLQLAATSGGQRLALLVAGHRAYREGLSLYSRFEIGSATERFEEAREALSSGGSPFSNWADFYLAVCSYQRYSYSAAIDRMKGVLRRASQRSYINLSGRALWVIGLCQIDAAQPVEALDTYEKALASFSRSRETESMISVQALLADALRYLGEDRKSWEHRYQALHGLDRLRDFRRRHAIVGEAALAALKLGRPLAAASFQDEAVELGERSQSPIDILEALRSRAAIHLRAGEPTAALADLQEASGKAAEVGEDSVRQIVLGRIREVEARLAQKSDPRKAVELLTEARRLFQQVGYRFPLAGIDVGRAQALFAAGQSTEARADLSAAVQEMEAEADQALQALRKGKSRDLWGELSLRAAYFEKGKDPFDQLLLHLAEEGDPREAWELAERERARKFLFSLLSLPSRPGLLRVPGSSVGALPLQEIQRGIPDRVALLQYESLEDRTLIWLLRENQLQMWVGKTGRAELESWITQARNALAGTRPRDTAEARANLERLFRALVEPALQGLGGVETLVFVPDGSLQDVPFAALVSPATGRHLIEDQAIEVAPSATLYVESLRRDRELAAHADQSALAVSDPTYDPSLFQALPALPHAGEEAAQVARTYPGSTLLTGAYATKARFLALVGRHGIIHAATHAVNRGNSPLLSTLVLAPEGKDSGALYAHELLGLRFEKTRLVVLSACSTAGNRREGGGEGFVRPLLGAGVPTVLASLWPVDDRVTAQLFSIFHARFRAGEAAPAALRTAQLALLRGTEPSLRTPKAWAGFEVFGGSKLNESIQRRTP